MIPGPELPQTVDALQNVGMMLRQRGNNPAADGVAQVLDIVRAFQEQKAKVRVRVCAWK